MSIHTLIVEGRPITPEVQALFKPWGIAEGVEVLPNNGLAVVFKDQPGSLLVFRPVVVEVPQ